MCIRKFTHSKSIQITIVKLAYLIPVIFFGLSAIRIGSLFHSTLFVIGAVICLVSGVVKVLWKLIAAVAKKNILLMFVQMRIFMPIGFIVLITALIVDRANLNGSAILAGLLSFPSCIFFAIGVIGMILMTVLAFKADSSNPKVNLTEQIINTTAQLCFFVGLMLI